MKTMNMTNQEKHEESKLKRSRLMHSVIPNSLKTEINTLLTKYLFGTDSKERNEKRVPKRLNVPTEDFNRMIEIQKYLLDNGVRIPELDVTVNTVNKERNETNGYSDSADLEYRESQEALGYIFKTYKSNGAGY
jgi:hypothetical protein